MGYNACYRYPMHNYYGDYYDSCGTSNVAMAISICPCIG